MSSTDVHNLGTFESIEDAWKLYPNGGGFGDYIIVDTKIIHWNEYSRSWGEQSESSGIQRPAETLPYDIDVKGWGKFRDGIKVGEHVPESVGAEIDKHGNSDFRTTRTDLLWVKHDGEYLRLDQYIKLFKTELPPDWQEYINAPLFNDMRILVFDPNSNSKYYTTVKSIKDIILADEESEGGTGGTIQLIRSDDYDATTPTDNNTYSALGIILQIRKAIDSIDLGLLTPEQVEILSFWKKDPDDPNTIFTDMNVYSTKELSAYGAGDGGGGGIGLVQNVYGNSSLGNVFSDSVLTETFNAYAINSIHERVQVLEAGGGGGGLAVEWGTLTNGYRQLTVEGVTYGLAESTHTHLWADITDKPSTFAPSAHTHAYSSLTGIPSTFAPSAHTHAYSSLTGIPSTFAPSAHTHAFASITSRPTTLSGYGITDGVANNRTVSAGNGLTGGGALNANITIELAAPSTLTAATSNNVSTSSHTHAITTTTVGLANTIVATDSNGTIRGASLKVGEDWSIELSGTELQIKRAGNITQRFLADGSIVGLGEVTAYGAGTGGEGVSLLRTGGTMTGDLVLDANLGVANKALTLLGNSFKYNGSIVLTEANTASKITMGNGWTIEQTSASLTIRKNGVIKGTFTA